MSSLRDKISTHMLEANPFEVLVQFTNKRKRHTRKIHKHTHNVLCNICTDFLFSLFGFSFALLSLSFKTIKREERIRGRKKNAMTFILMILFFTFMFASCDSHVRAKLICLLSLSSMRTMVEELFFTTQFNRTLRALIVLYPLPFSHYFLDYPFRVFFFNCCCCFLIIPFRLFPSSKFFFSLYNRLYTYTYIYTY